MTVKPDSWSGEIERNHVHLSSDEDGASIISGIAIGEGDITRGQSGVKKKWSRGALKPATDTLEDRPLVVDHQNTSYGTVGEVTHVEYEDGVGVLYEAELYDEELAEKVENGLLEVSIRGFHNDVEDMDTHAETGAKIVEKMAFDNLSIVPTGAAPSNTAQIGELDTDEVTGQAEAAEAPGVLSGPSTDISAAECAELMEGVEEAGENVPEGAEEEGNPDKVDEQPERYPEGTDTPSEEASEHAEADSHEENSDSPSGEDEEISPHDDADDQVDSQSRGAGEGDNPDSNVANVTLSDITMDDITDELEDYTDPQVVEGDQLSQLKKAASKVESLEEKVDELAEDDEQDETSTAEELKAQFEDDLAELKDRTSVLDDVDRSQVEDLAEAESPLIVEEDDYDELQEDVDTFHGVMAEMLSDEVDLSAETIEGKFSTSELKEELEGRREESLEEQVEEELSPDPKQDEVEEEELEEAAEEQHETSEEELSEDVEDAQARLREKMGIDE